MEEGQNIHQWPEALVGASRAKSKQSLAEPESDIRCIRSCLFAAEKGREPDKRRDLHQRSLHRTCLYFQVTLMFPTDK